MPFETGAERPRRWRTDAIAVLVIALLALLPRVIALSADPPHDMDMLFLTDEGLWANSAYNHAVFGRWVTDGHLAPLLVAPLYTGTLRLVYEIAGVGLVQTRLLAAGSGVLACIVLFAGLRLFLAPRQAFFPAAMLALSYFAISYSRTAFVESFQLLLLTGSFAATLAAARRPGWGLVAGVCFVLALLVKSSAAPLGAAFVAFWFLHRRRSGLGSGGIPFRLASPVLFAVGAGLILSATAVVLVIPHWELVREQYALSLQKGFQGRIGVPGLSDRVLLFGWSGFGLVRGAFFVQTVVPLVAVTLLGVARIARSERRPVDLPELLAWCWLLAGLLFLGTLQRQAARRFVELLPAVVVLAGIVFEGGVGLPRLGRGARSLRWRGALAGGLMLGVAGFYLYPFAGPLLNTAAGWFHRGPLTRMAGSSLVFSSAVLVGLAGGAFWLSANGERHGRSELRLSGLLCCLAFLVAEPARIAWYLSDPGFTVRDASNDLAAVTRDWPPGDRVITGEAANTLALGARMFAFTIRPPQVSGAAWINPDGWVRFHPAAVVLQPPPSPQFLRPRAQGFVECRRYDLWAEHGVPRFRLEILVRADLAPSCEGGSTAFEDPPADRAGDS